MLSPDSMMTDSKLTSVLRKLNAETNVPLDKTTLILKKMMQQNYITRTVDKQTEDEVIEWRVGPRGKMEIGAKGVQGLVKEVYGENAPEDLDKRLDRSLGLGKRKSTHAEGTEGDGVEAAEQNGGPSSRRVSRRGRPRKEADDEDEDEDEEDDNGE